MDSLTREPADLMTRPRSRRWLMVVLCVLVIAGIGYAIWFWPAGSGDQATRNRNANQPIPVLVATAEQKDVPIYLDALGTVQAFNMVTVKPMVDGPLNVVNFTEGQEVKKGDVLAQIDPRTYQAALDQATAKKAQDEAQLANARLDLARYTKLAANNYSSGQQADTARAQVAQLEALVNQDQAQIDNARTLLGYTTITSPLDGRTGMRQVDAGNIVHASDATGMVVITQMHPISVVFTLAAADAGAGEPGDGPGRGQGAGLCAGGDRRSDRRAGYRHADGAGQSGRSDHRHDQAEGDFPQYRESPVAGRIRRRADAGGYREGCRCAAACRGAARTAQHLCVCGQSRRLDDAAQRQGGARGRAGVDHHRGGQDRREGGDRWSVAAERTEAR